MKIMFTTFLEHFKFYIDYILKLDFGDLFFRFIELLLVIFLSLLINIPITLLKDLFYTIFSILGNSSVYVVLISDIFFSILSFLATVFAFIYCFNKRYEDLQKDIEEKSLEKKKQEQKRVQDALDLPKSKE